MNFDFSDRTRKVLAGARGEAVRLGHDYVGTEHTLLALCGEPEGRAAEVLRRLGANLENLRDLTEENVRVGTRTVRVGELPYTSRAKKVLEYAMAEGREMYRIGVGTPPPARGRSVWRSRKVVGRIGTEHLLLGLLREEKGIAAEVLNRVGVTLERARLETVLVLEAEGDGSGGWPDPALGGSMVSDFRVTVDDASNLSVYEQIIAQVTEAVATGVLRPGERLPPVRKLAEQADIAPGTVARAYSELEQQGVVITDGARGTRVAPRREAPVDGAERPAMLEGLLRPVVVAAFHLGASAEEVRAALRQAMAGIFEKREE